MFEEEIQVWVNDPVCPVLFAHTKGQFAVTADDMPCDEITLTPDEIDTIDRVLDYYAPHDAQWLSQLTHLEDPWNEARKNVPVDVRNSQPITWESMAMYYSGL